MKKIIGLAAPARSGKDSVAALLLEHHQVAAYALADPLKIGCQALFGLSDAETWDDAVKENKIALWQRSPREFFQHVGTDWMRNVNPDHWLMRAERAINQPAIPTPATIRPNLTDPQAPFKLATQAFFGLSAEQIWLDEMLDIIDTFWNLSPRQMLTLLVSLALEDFPDYHSRRAQRPIILPRQEIPAFDNADIIIIKDIRFENEADFLRRHHGVIWHIVRHNAQKVNAHSSEQGIQIKAGDRVIDNNGSLAQLALKVEKAWQQLQEVDLNG